MKRIRIPLIIAFLLSITAIAVYMRYIYIPQKAEEDILWNISSFGFENLKIGKIERENGKITLSDISLDEKSFSKIRKIVIDFSLYDYLFNGKKAQSITIQEPDFTGDLLENLELKIMGLNLKKNLSEKILELPANTIIIKDGRMNIMTQDYGGINVKFAGDLILDEKDGSISVQGNTSSIQKKLEFDGKVKGSARKGQISEFEIDFNHLKIENNQYKINRSTAKTQLIFQPSESIPSYITEAQISSMTWNSFPLSDVTLKLEKKGENASLISQGSTFGKQSIDWTYSYSIINDKKELEATITPPDFLYLEDFLNITGHISDKNALPASFYKIKSPVISIKSHQNEDTKSIKADFSILSSSPDIEIFGNFETKDDFVKGQFKTEQSRKVFAHNAKNDNKPAIYADIAMDGNFSYNKSNPITDVKINFDTIIKNGHADLELFMLNNIETKLSYDSKSKNLTGRDITFKLPIKDDTKYKAGFIVNPEKPEHGYIENIKLSIFGGTIKLKSPLIENKIVSPDNTLQIQDINLSRFFESAGIKGTYVNGTLGGLIPYTIKDGNLIVKDGILQSQNRGVIKLPPHIISGFFPGTNDKMERIRAALRNYNYEFFEIRLDGNLSGIIMMNLNASGFNPDLKDSSPVDLNLQIQIQPSLIFKNILK